MFYSKLNKKIILSQGDPSVSTSAFIGDIEHYGFVETDHKHNDLIDILSDVTIPEDHRYPIYLQETAKFLEIPGLATALAEKITASHVHYDYLTSITASDTELQSSVTVNIAGVDSVTVTAPDELTIAKSAPASATSNGYKNVNTAVSGNSLIAMFEYSPETEIKHQQLVFDILPRNI